MICSLCSVESEMTLCARCHARIHRQLDDLLELWVQAHSELLPARTGSGKSSSERTIGLNVTALSFVRGDDILSLLHEWEKLIRADLKLTPPAFLRQLALADEIAAAIKFAQAHLIYSSSQEWFFDYVREIRDLHSSARAAARIFVDKVRRISCPATTSDGLSCNFALKLTDDDLLALFSCRRCGSEWSALRLIKIALSASEGEIWLDSDAISSWLDVTRRQVLRFAQKHEIPKNGELIELKSLLVARARVGL